MRTLCCISHYTVLKSFEDWAANEQVVWLHWMLSWHTPHTHTHGPPKQVNAPQKRKNHSSLLRIQRLMDPARPPVLEFIRPGYYTKHTDPPTHLPWHSGVVLSKHYSLSWLQGEVKKKKNNWYSRTKTTSRAVKGNYDCTLDSELAVSKLIFNTGYCTLTHDTSCLNDRRFPESPLCCLPPVQPFQKENVLM